MQPLTQQKPTAFVDRRQSIGNERLETVERRQFKDSRSSIRPEVTELADAVDRYKMLHRRRFITFEELYDVMAGLGYRKN